MYELQIPSINPKNQLWREKETLGKKMNFCQGKSKNISQQVLPDASNCAVTEMRQIPNFTGKNYRLDF